MLSNFIIRLIQVLTLVVFTAPVYAANFTYDGVNRRDPGNELEQNTIEATGEIFCTAAKTGQLKATTGFLLDLGENSEQPVLITSGHTFRDSSDDEFHSDCRIRPYGSKQTFPLLDNFAGNLAQVNPADFIKNDWGLSILPAEALAVMNTITLSNRSYDEIYRLLQAGLGEIKFYGGNQIPEQGSARIQISDNCSIWQPTPRALLGSGHSIYTNCDSTGSSSGGALVLELYDGSVEAIGIMFGAIHTVRTVNQLLGDRASTMTIADIEHAINIIPSPETIINIAVPLIPGMREQKFDELFKEFSAL